MSDVVLSCSGLKKTYHTERGEVAAVAGIDLDVQAGRFAAIIGRSGSGKSSLMAMIGGLSRSSDGTVTVDVTITDELPRGARPDLSVDGTIELERLENVVYVGRPAFGQERTTVGIYKLDASGTYATRTPVQLGRSSVNTIEIVQGLQPGDRVILSDMTPWEANDRIKLN